jgi:hypothetical protein
MRFAYRKPDMDMIRLNFDKLSAAELTTPMRSSAVLHYGVKSDSALATRIQLKRCAASLR